MTAIQRFGGALNLNAHFHAIVLDGVHVENPDGSLRFQVLPPPKPTERLAAIAEDRVAAAGVNACAGYA